MRPMELRLPKEFDSSFVFFNEKGKFFPCPLHYHPEYELVLTLESTGKRYVGDDVSKFYPGDLVFMGSMLPHVWINDSKFIEGDARHDADALVIHFREDFLGKHFFDTPEMTSVKTILNHSKRGLALKGKVRERISLVMKRMLMESNIQRLTSLLTIFELMSSNVEYDFLSSQGYVESNNGENLSRFDDVIEYLRVNFNRDISLKEMAGIANMGLTTFCNLFKKNYRVTFTEYLIELRIGHACRLLLESNDENIAGIAYGCGYNSLANFNRQFKRIKGITPTEYKDSFYYSNSKIDNYFSSSKAKNKYLVS